MRNGEADIRQSKGGTDGRSTTADTTNVVWLFPPVPITQEAANNNAATEQVPYFLLCKPASRQTTSSARRRERGDLCSRFSSSHAQHARSRSRRCSLRWAHVSSSSAWSERCGYAREVAVNRSREHGHIPSRQFADQRTKRTSRKSSSHISVWAGNRSSSSGQIRVILNPCSATPRTSKRMICSMRRSVSSLAINAVCTRPFPSAMSTPWGRQTISIDRNTRFLS